MWPDRERRCSFNPRKKTPEFEARIKNRDNRRANKRMK